MILAGDTAIMAGAGAYIHDIAIMGSTTPDATGAPTFHARGRFNGLLYRRLLRTTAAHYIHDL